MGPESPDEMLARLDERTTTIQKTLEKNDKILQDFVRRAEFQPVQRLVYGVVGLILTAVVAALVSLVVSAGGFPPL